MDDYKKSRANVASKFQQAEDDIKVAENVVQSLKLSAMNELRYVGRYMSYAFFADKDKDRKSNLLLAEKHANRAIYDAVDEVIAFSLREIDKFRHDHSDIDVVSIVPDYDSLIERADVIIDKINRVRMKEKQGRDENGSKVPKVRTKRRPTNYNAYREYRDDLVKISKRLDRFRTKLTVHRRKANRKNAIILVLIGCTVVSAIIGGALIYLGTK